MENIDQIINLKKSLVNIMLSQWKDTVFSFQWWLLAVLLVASYALWWKLVDKKKLTEILFMGSLIAVMDVIFDMIATLYGLWTYNVRFFPIIPSVFPFDFSILPVTFMLVYQFYPTWKKYYAAAALASAAFSFVMLPLLVSLDILIMQQWSYLYEFGALYAEVLFARAVMAMVLGVQKQATALSITHRFAQFSGAQPATKPLEKDDPSD